MWLSADEPTTGIIVISPSYGRREGNNYYPKHFKKSELFIRFEKLINLISFSNPFHASHINLYER